MRHIQAKRLWVEYLNAIHLLTLLIFLVNVVCDDNPCKNEQHSQLLAIVGLRHPQKGGKMLRESSWIWSPGLQKCSVAAFTGIIPC